MRKYGANLYNITKAAVVVVSCVLSFYNVLLRNNIYDSDMYCTQLIHLEKKYMLALELFLFQFQRPIFLFMRTKIEFPM